MLANLHKNIITFTNHILILRFFNSNKKTFRKFELRFYNCVDI